MAFQLTRASRSVAAVAATSCCGDQPQAPSASSREVAIAGSSASEDSEQILQLKLVLLGASGVGKTNIGRRFLKEEFSEGTEVTVGAAYCTHDVQVKNKGFIRYAIWDTAGQERFGSLTPMYYRGASVAIIVFDITAEETFERAKKYVREVRENVDGVYIHLVGNKVDLEPNRAINKQARRHTPRTWACSTSRRRRRPARTARSC
eukprot:TRINITY_DN18073_c0_g1_i1.p2 TRINITY_DN18073_c0_g1~~TRINITY_DN18073_c0_g1_i1.p2  ORF type:complete len:205 (-),score=9.69 TRINITY_DN18073_c0_g1_i1:125-739(-)